MMRAKKEGGVLIGEDERYLYGERIESVKEWTVWILVPKAGVCDGRAHAL